LKYTPWNAEEAEDEGVKKNNQKKRKNKFSDDCQAL
jgi:hypothetical protein